jgi:hypothetical protein
VDHDSGGGRAEVEVKHLDWLNYDQQQFRDSILN